MTNFEHICIRRYLFHVFVVLVNCIFERKTNIMIIRGSFAFWTLFVANSFGTVKSNFVECPPGTQFSSIAASGMELSISNDDDATALVDLPFSYDWLGTVAMEQLRVTTNGMVLPTGSGYTFDGNGCCSPLPLEIGGNSIAAAPRLSVIHEDLNPSQGGSIYVEGDTSSYAISYEGVPFFLTVEMHKDKLLCTLMGTSIFVTLM